MAHFVRKPNCCGQFIGQLFGRIAAGSGSPYYQILCGQCQAGARGTEVEVDFDDGGTIRGVTRDQLEAFRTQHLSNWSIHYVRQPEVTPESAAQPETVAGVTGYVDDMRLVGPMQVALQAVEQELRAV